MDPFIKVTEWFQMRGISFSSKEKCFFRSRTLVKSFEPYQILMQQDETVEHLYFLNAGIVHLFRSYKGVDYTLGFVDSRDFVSTPLYVLNGEKSSCSLETLTQASALQWDYEDIIAFKKHMPQLAYSMELVLLDRLLSWVQQNQIECVRYS